MIKYFDVAEKIHAEADTSQIIKFHWPKSTFCDRTPCIFAISLDHNKNKVDFCQHLLDSTWFPAQPNTHHFDQVAMFLHLNLRILDWERLLLYHQELDKYFYLIMLIFFTRRPVLVYGEVY